MVGLNYLPMFDILRYKHMIILDLHGVFLEYLMLISIVFFPLFLWLTVFSFSHKGVEGGRRDKRTFLRLRLHWLSRWRKTLERKSLFFVSFAHVFPSTFTKTREPDIITHVSSSGHFSPSWRLRQVRCKTFHIGKRVWFTGGRSLEKCFLL